MQIAPESSINEIVALLADCALPVADISLGDAHQFFGVRFDGSLVAVVGLELYPPVGLLRSLAVSPTHRGEGLGRKLVLFVETFAVAQSIEAIFLLTTTVERFFVDLGYTSIPRDTAPAPIQATQQFSDLCPASSTLMSKRLSTARGSPGRRAV